MFKNLFSLFKTKTMTRRKTNKRKTNKRKTNKRKTNKRKTRRVFKMRGG
jgi:hypothetical protein